MDAAVASTHRAMSETATTDATWLAPVLLLVVCRGSSSPGGSGGSGVDRSWIVCGSTAAS